MALLDHKLLMAEFKKKTNAARDIIYKNIDNAIKALNKLFEVSFPDIILSTFTFLVSGLLNSVQLSHKIPILSYKIYHSV
jgi:hypothetical protein